MSTILAFLETTTAQTYLANLDQKNLQSGMSAEDRERDQKINNEWMKVCQNNIQLFETSKPGEAFCKKENPELLTTLQPTNNAQNPEVERHRKGERIAHISSRNSNHLSAEKIDFLLKIYEEIRWFGF